MTGFFQKCAVWWLATMVPAHTSMTTLIEREYERKRRLLGILLFFSLVITLVTSGPASFIVSSVASYGWIECSIPLAALWLNRKGHLTLASLTLFFGEGAALFLATHLLSLHDPLTLLWTLAPMPLLLVLAGLFLPAWNILLMALVETLLLFWYFLVQQHDQIVHLLSSQQRWSFLNTFFSLIVCSAMIGILYTVTTKKALIQADRAAELKLAHDALTEAYTNLEQAHATIQRQALTDGLTGLPNRRATTDQLEKELVPTLDALTVHSRCFSSMLTASKEPMIPLDMPLVTPSCARSASERLASCAVATPWDALEARNLCCCCPRPMPAKRKRSQNASVRPLRASQSLRM